MDAKPLDVLLVEDSPSDVFLTQEAIREAGLEPVLSLHVVNDGVEALEYLRRQTPHESASRPDLILLDLNMPRKDGREVLADVKSDDALRTIPIIVLTTSSAESDLSKAYALGANGYIVKPHDFGRFREAISGIELFWAKVARLPSRT